MGNFKFILNKKGVSELLRSEEVMDCVNEYANDALSRLGSGYSTNTRIGKVRANAEVKADSAAARRENTKNNTLLKALK